MYKEKFLAFAGAIQSKQVIEVTFVAKNRQQVTRRCIPLDFAPSERDSRKAFKYHMWSLDSTPKHHIVSLTSEQIIQLKVLEEIFDPKNFISWTRKWGWTIGRDWGELS